MTDAEKWYDEKIAIFTKEKEELVEISAKIGEYEKMVEKLRSIKREELLNGATVFNCKKKEVNEADGEHEHVETDMVSFNLESDDDIKLLDDIRCLMVFELQKRIGKLKESRKKYDYLVMGRESLIDGISRK